MDGIEGLLGLAYVLADLECALSVSVISHTGVRKSRIEAVDLFPETSGLGLVFAPSPLENGFAFKHLHLGSSGGLCQGRHRRRRTE